MAELLIAAGSDIFAKTKTSKRTPLHLAAEKGHAATVGKLIAAEAAGWFWSHLGLDGQIVQAATNEKDGTGAVFLVIVLILLSHSDTIKLHEICADCTVAQSLTSMATYESKI